MEQLVTDVAELKQGQTAIKGTVDMIWHELKGTPLDSDGLINQVKEHETALMALLKSDISTKLYIKQIQLTGRIIGTAIVGGIVTILIFMVTGGKVKV